MDEALCLRCRFFVPMDATEDAGSCHRYPPAAVNDRFPSVECTDWCGEFSLGQGREDFDQRDSFGEEEPE